MRPFHLTAAGCTAVMCQNAANCHSAQVRFTHTSSRAAAGHKGRRQTDMQLGLQVWGRAGLPAKGGVTGVPCLEKGGQDPVLLLVSG